MNIKPELTKLAKQVRDDTIETCLELMDRSHDLAEAKRNVRRLKAELEK